MVKGTAIRAVTTPATASFFRVLGLKALSLAATAEDTGPEEAGEEDIRNGNPYTQNQWPAYYKSESPSKVIIVFFLKLAVLPCFA
jgi:hypothetical protein